MVELPIQKIGTITSETNRKLFELTRSAWGEYSTGSPAEGVGRMKVKDQELIRDILNPHYGEVTFENVLFHNMKPGQIIKEHQDINENPKDLHVCHIPIKTNEGATLTFASIEKHFELNSIYEVNFSYPHSCKNEGITDRIHLFIQFRSKCDLKNIKEK